MARAGYQCLHPNIIGTAGSKQIGSPRNWLYPYLTRSYTSEEQPAIIKAIGVILIDPDQSATVPALLIGTFKSTGVPGEDGNYKYGYLSESWFKIAGERQFNKQYQVQGLDHLETGVIQAFPIDAVSDAETLNTHLIQPLLAMDHRLDRQD